MILAVLCAAIAGVGVALCLVLAEPWQRPRYERVADQAYFWTYEWLVGEAEADDDLAAGRYTVRDADAWAAEFRREAGEG